MCSSASPFHLPMPVRVSMHEAVLGFHIKTSPCFKAKLVFIGAFEPWKRVDSCSFFDGSPCLGEIFSNAPLYSSDTQVGQRKWDSKFFISDWYGPASLEFWYSRPLVLTPVLSFFSFFLFLLEQKSFWYQYSHELLTKFCSIVTIWWQAHRIFL